MMVVHDRSEMIDIAKGIGILLVFLGHSLYSGTDLFKVIFSFHMPLFFFLSGVVFCYKANLPFKHVCGSLLRTLLMPYLFFNILGLATVPVREIPLGLWKIVVSVLLGHSWLNGPSWFLIALFSVTLISWCLINLKGSLLIKWLLVVLFYVPSVFAVDITGCDTVMSGISIDPKIPNIVHTVILVIQIAVPVVLVILGMLDLFKGMTAQKEDEIKKAQQMFVKRLVSGVLVFFVILIVKLVVSFAAGDKESDTIMTCASCFLNGVNSDGTCK